MSVKIQTAQGALLGLALGDALGTTLEFKTKDSYQHITDIVGGGPFNLQPGQWTDDTSMMLCLAQSLLATGYNDLDDQMYRYVDWYQNGTNSCTGRCFDIGNTVRNALESFMSNSVALAGSEAEYSAGNGSLMRVAPIALAYHDCDFDTVRTVSYLSSSTTHAEKRCLDACELMSYFLYTLLNRDEYTMTKQALLTLPQAFLDIAMTRWDDSIKAIALGNYKDKGRDLIKGTGFVVESLEAALWCFYQTDNFKDGALLAANLGNDADTTAAIYGQIAGAFYGVDHLPTDWLNILAWKDDIAQLAFDLITIPNNEVIREFLLKNIKMMQFGIEGQINTHDDNICVSPHRQDNISTLITSAYEFNIVISGFDWALWRDEHFNHGGTYDFEYWLSKADRVECIKYLSMCIRQDRFSDGYLESQVQEKVIPKVLHKLMHASMNQDIAGQLSESDFF